MRQIGWLLLVGGMVWGNGCSCSNSGTGGGDDLGIPDGANPDSIAGGDIVITPMDATLDLMPGGPAQTQSYTATLKDGSDVTAMASWSVDDTNLGAMSGNVFTSNTSHGGSSYVRASYNGLSGYATIHVKLHASVSSTTCPGCPPFPPDSTPACSAAAQTPTILYPPNGILVPPNMNVLETQFDQGMGNALFEIDFENAATDVRVETKCNPITDSKGSATNGCSYDLDQSVWDFISNSNRGGDPLNIIVRATDQNGTCIATSQAQIAISFAQEDLNGGIYYWQSVAVSGLNGATGGIFRYDFGVRGQAPTPFLAPTASGGNNNRCIGCHFLSRDGQKMTYGNDDEDADDEYSDLVVTMLDVSTKAATPIYPKGVGGFQAFSPDHAHLLASDGTGVGNAGGPVPYQPNSFSLFNGTSTSATILTPSFVPIGARATQPDWSADGSKIVFVEPKSYAFPTYTRVDDNHFTGGSLYTMTFSGGTFGQPTPLLPSQGENNYYPGWSPDGAFVIFNQVPLTGTPNACTNVSSTSGSCPNDSFSNPAARVFLLPSAGGAPIDLAHLNGMGRLANSWPRFAPTVQMYKGHQIAWVTFSSIRDYGEVVRNSALVGGAPQHMCYPPESPENSSTNKMVTENPSCFQPQLWMAAIDLTGAAAGTDSSFPAFWLPFQDAKEHNHIAQWVVSIAGPPPPDGGAPDGGPSCTPDNTPCTPGSANCCNGICCSTSVCGCIP